ncbi:cytochrome c4, partial [Pseudoalteromonas sp. S1649]
KEFLEVKLGMSAGGYEVRMDPVMSGMAMPLSDHDMIDLAAYFSSLYMSEGATPKDVVEVGQQLYKAADAERGITACAAWNAPPGNV